MHTFQIKTLMQIFNFGRLLHVSNLLGSSSERQLLTQFLYDMFTTVFLRMNYWDSKQVKDVKNWKIEESNNFKSVHFFG